MVLVRERAKVLGSVWAPWWMTLVPKLVVFVLKLRFSMLPEI